jgi:hypothetical protein
VLDATAHAQHQPPAELGTGACFGFEDERAVPKRVDARLAGSLLLHFQAGKRVRQGGEVVGRRPRIADARFQDLAHGAVVRLGLLDLISRACGFASLSLSLSPGSREVPGDKRRRAVVPARKLALWRPGISRG